MFTPVLTQGHAHGQVRGSCLLRSLGPLRGLCLCRMDGEEKPGGVGPTAAAAATASAFPVVQVHTGGQETTQAAGSRCPGWP